MEDSKTNKPKKESKMAQLIARKKTKGAAAQQKASGAEQNEQPTDPVDGVPARQQAKVTEDTTKVRKDASSDEEEDDSEVNTGAWANKIREGKEATGANVADTKKIDPYGLEEKKEPAAGARKVEGPPRKNADNISFQGKGKPTFSNRTRAPKTQFASANDFGGLDELDDEGNEKKPKKNDKRATGAADDSKAEEEKSNSKPAEPVKPKFRGKLNLTRTGDGAEPDAQAGKAASTNYGFEVKYKSDRPPNAGEPKEGGAEGEKGGDGQKPEMRKDRRNKDRGTKFDGFKKAFGNDNEDEDDDFQVVTDKTKNRRTRKFKKDDSDSEEENGQKEDGYTLNQRGFRGGRGRGGFEGRGRGGAGEGFQRAGDRKPDN